MQVVSGLSQTQMLKGELPDKLSMVTCKGIKVVVYKYKDIEKLVKLIKYKFLFIFDM